MAFSQWTSLFSVHSQPTLAKESRTTSETTQVRLELVKQATTRGGFNWDLTGGQQDLTFTTFQAVLLFPNVFCGLFSRLHNIRWWQVKNLH